MAFSSLPYLRKGTILGGKRIIKGNLPSVNQETIL